jgi:cobalt/nickel transport system permease protein
MENKIPSYLSQGGHEHQDLLKAKKPKLSFLNRTILNAAVTIKSIYLQAENATGESFIHRIHPNIKFISLIYLEIVISLVRQPQAQLVATLFFFILYQMSGLKIWQVYRKILFLAFFFGFLVVLPASLNVISPGKIIFNLVTFHSSSQFWIYHIPQHIGVTSEGLQVVLLVFLRVLNSVSIAFLIVYTTSFPAFVKSFKIAGVPDAFLMVISLAYKYIFLLSRTIEETFFALKSRMISHIRNGDIRKLFGGMIFSIFRKSMKTYEDTWSAMVSRGYRGKVILHSTKRVAAKDFVALLIIVILGIGLILL